MRKPFPVYALAAVAGLLMIFDVAPFLLLLPFNMTDLSTGIVLLLIVGAGGYVAWLAVKLAPERKRTLLIAVVAGAVLNVLTQVVTRVLPSAILDRMIPGVIAPLFGLDGEYAYDAAGYELWWEIWVILALIACAIGWAIQRALQAKAQ